MKQTNIAIIGDTFMGWTGGANLCGYFTKTLLKAAETTGDNIYFLLNGSSLPKDLFKKQKYIKINSSSLNLDGPIRSFFVTADNLKEVYLYLDLDAALAELGIEVVAPTGLEPGSYKCAWAGYIPDFQHQYLPYYFSQAERLARDARFRRMIENCSVIYVNSQSVIEDIRHFYPGIANTKAVYRFPVLLPEVGVRASVLEEVLSELKIQQDYLISCSQRWVHKQHDLIIKGFNLYISRNPHAKLDLIFTGVQDDYRFNRHKSEIKNLVDSLNLTNRVRNVGLIERSKQIALISKSKALIQASLFEGGAGASGVLEASLLGVPIIASNIGVNFENQFGRMTYFESKNPESLAAAIEKVAANANKKNVPPFEKDQVELITKAAGLIFINELKSIII